MGEGIISGEFRVGNEAGEKDLRAYPQALSQRMDGRSLLSFEWAVTSFISISLSTFRWGGWSKN